MIDRRSLLGTAAALAVSPAWAQSQVVDAPCGPLRGLVGQGVQAYLGIPYAEPPVGSRRYASPSPAPRWTEVRDAGKPGAAPIQTLPPWAAWIYETPEPQAEDCLFLNVYTPDPRGRRPVMVWLHGGAWRTGQGDTAGTKGTALAAAGDVVVVTVNYRLGALGWLAHPDLADPATGAFANWGLQDQVAALRWVQANIAAFGGDPARVTLFGHSAGGSSVASIAQDKRNAGLVHRLIIESGSLHGAPGFPEVKDAAAYAEALARRLGVTVAGLRDVAATTLHRTELEQARGDPALVRSLGRPPVLPVLDGVVLKVWPRDGLLAPLPLLIGTTRTEGTFWYDLMAPDGRPVPGLPPPKDREQLVRMTRDLVGLYRPEAATIAAERIVEAYEAAARSRGEPEDAVSIWVGAYTDIVFRLRARACAARHAASGNAAYLYEFDHKLRPPARGVPHSAEIPFVFGTFSDPFFAAKVGAGPEEAALSDFMLLAWSQFAHDGDPGPGWAAADNSLPVNVLGGDSKLRSDARWRTQELIVWE
ncbi:MAG TPA: carboxylesterase family protein [Acetobacteraceae bacterium]|nr:carboxylesterase family protein [Acetobacteraceae bacterium]